MGNAIIHCQKYGSLLLTFHDEAEINYGENALDRDIWNWSKIMNVQSCLLGRLCYYWQLFYFFTICQQSVGANSGGSIHCDPNPLNLRQCVSWKKKTWTMWTSILNVAIQRYGNKALCFFLLSECSGMHRLNTSEVSPCGEASSRWWSEPCARCVNAVVVWIVIAALCVKLAQGRDRNSPPLTTHSHSLRADADFHVSITPHMQHNRKNNEDVVFLYLTSILYVQ